LGSVSLFDWDEINFAECAREMIVSKDYLNVQINFEPFWEKPPLFIWMQVFCMKIFGVNEFAARLPNAICGVVTLLFLYSIGRKMVNESFGLIWVVCFTGSILPSFYFRSGIIDPWFNLFIFSGIYFFYQAHASDYKKLKSAFFSGILIGLAILTKGPVAFLLFSLTTFLFLLISAFELDRKSKRVRTNLIVRKSIFSRDFFFSIVMFIVALIIFGGFWFFLQLLNGNGKVVMDFIIYQIRLFTTKDAGHGGFFGYHFVVLAFGVLPASVFMIQNLFSKNRSNDEINSFRQLMLVLFWVVLILFSIVKTKIIHYSSLAYFPMTFLAAMFIYQIKNENERWRKWFNWTFFGIGVFFMIVFLVIRYLVFNTKEVINSGIIKDDFANANLLADVKWSGFEFLIGLIPISALLIAHFRFRQNDFKKIVALFSGFIVFTTLLSFVIIPKIEGYSQRAAIEFYKSKINEDCYVTTHNFKSYAHLFYTQKKMPVNRNHLNNEWLMKGVTDKKVYVVCKIQHTLEFESNYNEFSKIKSKNGFVFYERSLKK
jgi:4-amino-4-deoxy-L-arabinose transferase-like glycosyltransferase